MTEFLGINFGKFCGSMALMVSCYAPLSHSLPTGGLCFGKWQAIKAVPCGRWTPARMRFVVFVFNVYMNWIDKCSQADECATIGNRKISCLLFADELALLFFSKSGLQRGLNSFVDACDTAGIKISTAKY